MKAKLGMLKFACPLSLRTGRKGQS